MLSQYEKDLHTHYAQVRKRLRGEVPKSIMAIPPRPEPEPEPEPEQICEIVQELDERPIARTLIFSKAGFIIAEGMSAPAPEPIAPRRSFNEVLKDVSRETQTSIREILGKRRHQWLVEIRRVLWWRVAHECPHLSIADIGRRSGVDHTTVLHALKRYAELNGLPYPAHRVK